MRGRAPRIGLDNAVMRGVNSIGQSVPARGIAPFQLYISPSRRNA